MLAAVTIVAEIMKRDILTVEPSDSIGEAAEKMTERGVGAVVVTDFGRIIGILTERDILKAVAYRTHSSEARVRQWMTPDPILVAPDTDAAEAAHIMLENNFRHLPVVDSERPVGIVSLRDVARWSIDVHDAEHAPAAERD
jgi:CBS domain-containing protein